MLSAPSRLACLFLICFALLAPATARGDSAADAVTELKAGYALKQTGDCHAALPHFLASFGLAPKPKAVLNAADCEQQLGDLVAARAHATRGRALAEMDADTELARVASEQLAAIEKRLPTLTITLKADAPASSSVTLDGAPVPALDAAVPANPGSHTVAVQAPGHAERTFPMTLVEGQSARLEVAPGSATATDAPAPTEDDPGFLARLGTQRTVALGLGAVGAAGLIVGTVFGLVAIGNNNGSNANGHCDSTGCDGTGTNLRNTALSDAMVSNVAFGVGLAALAGGAILYFTARSTASPANTARLGLAPTLSRDGGGLTLGGAW